MEKEMLDILFEGKSFGQAIKLIREQRKLTQKFMAYRLGVNVSSYSDIERDKVSLKSKVLRKVFSSDLFNEKERKILLDIYNELATHQLKNMRNDERKNSVLTKPPITFGQQLEIFRKNKGLSIARMVEKINQDISISVFRKVLNDKIPATQSVVYDIATSEYWSEEESEVLVERYQEKVDVEYEEIQIDLFSEETTFGEVLEFLRLEKGETIKEMARKLGVSDITYRNAERNGSKPHQSTLNKMLSSGEYTENDVDLLLGKYENL